MGKQDVVYHDISPRSSAAPPPSIPTGAAIENDEPKKKMSLFSKVAIGSIVVMSIVLAVVLTRPGALGAFSQDKNSKADGGGDGDPTYVPTYTPTYVPTYLPTVGGDDTEEKEEDGGTTTTTTVAATEAAANATEGVTTTTPFDFAALADLVGNVTNSTTSTTEDIIEEEVVTTPAATSTTAATTTTTTTELTTTTEQPHPVCGTNTTYKVFKIQYTPSTPNATYTFSSKSTGTIYSSNPPDLPINEIYEEKVCVPGGEYEFQMSAGACVNGFYRGEQILFSCLEGGVLILVEEKDD
mmetsp:Transcript_14398/g.22215  ORF Transcript_14398/g.22215 Transcript_14398/m.22215 type:complete len:297 (+) Transcript_14398:64-954(+)